MPGMITEVPEEAKRCMEVARKYRDAERLFTYLLTPGLMIEHSTVVKNFYRGDRARAELASEDFRRSDLIRMSVNSSDGILYWELSPFARSSMEKYPADNPLESLEMAVESETRF